MQLVSDSELVEYESVPELVSIELVKDSELVGVLDTSQ
jgi:hypothetical protein